MQKTTTATHRHHSASARLVQRSRSVIFTNKPVCDKENVDCKAVKPIPTLLAIILYLFRLKYSTTVQRFCTYPAWLCQCLLETSCNCRDLPSHRFIGRATQVSSRAQLMQGVGDYGNVAKVVVTSLSVIAQVRFYMPNVVAQSRHYIMLLGIECGMQMVET